MELSFTISTIGLTIAPLFDVRQVPIYLAIMATGKIRRDASSQRVAHNVAELRSLRGLSLRDLSVRLRQLGRPILPSGLFKVESGERRVDTDDLVALAVALDVTPTRLLLPATAEDRKMALTPSTVCEERTAWAWAVGDHELPREPWADSEVFDLSRAARFRYENRPHDPPSEMDMFEATERYGPELRQLAAAVKAARDAGLSEREIREYVKLTETAMTLAAAVETAKGARRGKRR